MRTPSSGSLILSVFVALAGATLFATTSVTVTDGDTLSAIAARHGISTADLVEWNDIDDPDRIFVGDIVLLVAPADGDTPTRHVVSAGETLSLIARLYGESVADLAAANGLDDPDVIRAGQALTIGGEPAAASDDDAAAVDTDRHTVAAGETLFAIARRYDRSIAALVAANDLADPDRIRAGDRLRIPAADEADDAPTPQPELEPDDDGADADDEGHEGEVDEPATDDGDDDAAAAEPDEADSDTDADAGDEDEDEDASEAAEDDAATEDEADDEDTVTPTTTVPSSASASALATAFDRWALSYGVDRALLEAVTWHASDWQPTQTGDDGRLGIGGLTEAQVELVESRLLGLDLDPLDTSDGVRLAARYLRYVQDRTHTERDALIAFRQGLSSFLDDGAKSSAESFADEVLAIRDQRS